jgi:galactokinase
LTRHTWANYALCGVKAILSVGKIPAGKGLGIVVTGDIPQGAGLSSSSALVCSVAQGVAKVLGVEITRAELARLATDAERYVGNGVLDIAST